MSAEKLKHTPGPWKLKGLNPPRIYADEGKEIICQCDSMGEMTQSQEKANARLIAAAPELLAALELLLPMAEKFCNNAGNGADGQGLAEHSVYVIQARAAIAKAKGEA